MKPQYYEAVPIKSNDTKDIDEFQNHYTINGNPVLFRPISPDDLEIVKELKQQLEQEKERNKENATGFVQWALVEGWMPWGIGENKFWRKETESAVHSKLYSLYLQQTTKSEEK